MWDIKLRTRDSVELHIDSRVRNLMSHTILNSLLGTGWIVSTPEKNHHDVHPNREPIGPRVKMADFESFCPLPAMQIYQCLFRALNADNFQRTIPNWQIMP